MPAITWSDNQRAAIDAANSEVLVSAGAGSGKTAVLVERVIDRVLNATPPIEIEQILAVTFTEEAAAQMRRRIDQAIRKKLEEGVNPALERQLALLERSWISTLDSFCLRLIRENFQALGIDPQVKVLGEEEARLLELETADALFESLYEQAEGFGAAFNELVEHYGGARQDEGLRDVMLALHGILETVLEPGEWLRKAINQYRDPEQWLCEWRDFLLECVGPLLEQLHRCVHDLQQAGDSPKVLAVALIDQAAVQALFNQLQLEDAATALEGVAKIEWPKMPRITKAEEGSAARKQFNEFRKKLKPELEKAWAIKPAEFRAIVRRLLPFVRTLGSLTMQFRRAFAQAKREQGVMDFADLERCALRLLKIDEIAARMHQRFEQVIIDEYQDINPLQDEILRLASRPEPSNRFMVGDVKQCIYGFRLADPSLFVGKLQTFEDDPQAARRKIFLPDNYRSREQILDAVNTLFGRILAPCLGGLSYEAGDRLRAQATYEECPTPAPVELVFIDCREEEAPAEEDANGEENGEGADVLEQQITYSNLECQALEIGRRILEWTGRSGQPPLLVQDGSTKQMRPVRAGDMAILMRSTSQRASAVIETLNALGIEVVTTRETTFFESMEVMDVLSVLHVLDNPRQDIHLAAVLRSPMFNFSEGDLAQIGMTPAPDPEHPRKFFHESVGDFLANGGHDDVKTRLQQALEQIERWRAMARSKPLADVIRTILDETGYADFVLGLRGGDQRRARLDAIVERARQFASFHRPTLYRFLRFIGDLAERAIEIKAPPPPPAGDAVRLMTIHQSKGLEFPVVFLPDLDKKFNTMDTKNTVLLERNGGIGLIEVYPDSGIRRDTVMRHLIGQRIRRETSAEEARLLYVAMTRARERLVMLGCAKLNEDVLGTWQNRAGMPGRPLEPSVLLGANGYLDWIAPALSPFPTGQPAFHRNFWISCVRHQEAGGACRQLLDLNQGAQQDKPWVEDLREAGTLSAPPWQDHPLAREIAQRIDWHYPKQALAGMRAKWSVTEFKSRLEQPHEQDEAVERKFVPPNGMQKADSGKLSARERGIVFHAIMQHLDLEAGDLTSVGLNKQMEAMARQGWVEAEQCKGLDLSPIEKFLHSEQGRWLIEHRGQLRRELPFCLALPAEWVAAELGADSADERVVVQGVIDALIETPGGFWVLDYKTDSIDADKLDERAESYRPQMSLYAQAVHRILKRPVLGAVLVFLTVGESRKFAQKELLAWRPSLK